MIAVIDYGVGNLYSIMSSLRYLGLEARLTSDPADLAAADRIILPGVGAFGDGMAMLSKLGFAPAIKEQMQRKPLLGICLGMQLLFETSFEFGEHSGLGLIPGEIKDLSAALADSGYDYKVPQMGWNKLDIINSECPLIKYFRGGDSVYYTHSFYADGNGQNVAAASEYGISIAGIVHKGNIFGTQFHPEKSGETGLMILKAFAEI